MDVPGTGMNVRAVPSTAGRGESAEARGHGRISFVRNAPHDNKLNFSLSLAAFHKTL